MFYISYGTTFLNGTAAFRIPWGLQMIPAILLFIFLLFLPESPRWLARKDRWEEAKTVLALGKLMLPRKIMGLKTDNGSSCTWRSELFLRRQGIGRN
jgi:hypothetical protein